ncbi:MAG: M48 family metallopeptidase [Ignavibacteria bacterium]|nr:M48 family metallopeptidase [Ignavibacteria bacterium]
MDDKIKYGIEHSKRTSITIILKSNGEVIVRAPYGIPDDYIDNFVREKQSRILKRLSLMKSRIPQTELRKFEEGEEFPYLGKMYRLKLAENIIDIIEIKDEIYLDSNYKHNIKSLLKAFYRDKAQEYLEKRVKHLAEKTGFTYGSIKVTTAEKRLGTCTHYNDLRFSYLLIMFPPEISDYIIYHELSHIKEKNHSPRFWKLVEVYVPDYKQKKKWLKENINHYKFF